MGLRKVTDAAAEPLTLAEAKAHLNVFETSRDTYITTLIGVARTWCEEYLQRSLIDTTWELTLDAFPTAIKLPRPRVRSVTTLQYIDTSGNLQTLNSNSYKLDDKSEPGWIVPAYGYSWPSTRDDVNAVIVTYVAGYGANAAAVPLPIKQWILLALGTMFDNREIEVTGAGLAAAELRYSYRLIDTYKYWSV